MADWHTAASARDEWPDAPVDSDGGDARLESLLASAKEAVIAYAPAVSEPLEDIPDGYREAQLQQAQNMWNAGKASPSGDFDGGQYSLTTFPLDWAVRQLIRPKTGKPVIG
jgi:hypothetical protein